MKLSVFFFLQLKRLFKHKLFLLLLLMFPLCLFLLSHAFREEEDSRRKVGLCLATEDALTETLYRKLLTLEDSLFVFSPVSSEEDLKKAVQSNRFECGYLFEKPLGTELDKSRLKNLITVYVSENTTCEGILNELVYANLFEEYALSLLQTTLTEAGHLPFTDGDAVSFSLPSVTKEAIEEAYRSHLSDGSTFRIEVQFVTDSGSLAPADSTAASTPLLRGLSALFLLLCGFLSLLVTYHDEANGLYARLHSFERVLFPRITMLTYLVPSGLVCLLGSILSGSFTNPLTEVTALLCYLVALLLFYTLLGTLLRNHTMLCAAFPMLVLCTLVFTPVLTDLSVFFPWLRVVRYALPSYYYLMFF